MTDPPANDHASPWAAALRRLKRLELLQLAVLVVVAALAVTVAIVLGRANSDASAQRKDEQSVQSGLVTVRDRLRVEYAAFLERRARGETGTTPGAVAAVELGRRVLGELALMDDAADDPEEAATIERALRSFDALQAFVRSVQGSTAEIGSPRDSANLARFAVIRQEVEAAVEAWITTSNGELSGLEARQSDLTRILVVWLPIALGLLTLTGVGVWRILDRARRRVTVALGDLASEQSALREVAVGVAAEESPEAVFALVARVASQIVGADGAAVTRFDGSEGVLVGHWDSRPETPRPATRVVLTGETSTARVFQTGRPIAVDYADAGIEDVDTAELGQVGYRSSVGAPVCLGERMWGAVSADSTTRTLPDDAAVRLAHLADLLSLSLENAEARRQLSDRAERDPLTGLANHRTFQERLRAEADRAETSGGMALVLFDIDHFKEINDTHGHQAGDDVLVDVALRIARHARTGELVARFGGEEFAWIMPGADAVDAWNAAERVRQDIASDPVSSVGHITVSAGVCSLAEAEGPQDLFRFADGALYWAKAQGRNATCRYTPEVIAELSSADRAERLARAQALTALQALARAVDARDASTRRHAERVGDLAAGLALEMGWPRRRADLLRQAGIMHDVGKLAVSDAILLKPGRLTDDEMAVMTEHAQRGAEIVTGVLTPEQVGWVRHHHERWDGGGYPARLAGEEIPDGARVLALADAWDVMTSVRTYGSPRSADSALAECRACAGTQFCETAVEALARLVTRGHVGNGRPTDFDQATAFVS